MSNVNAAARLDRLPISKWHYKFMALVFAGLLFEMLLAGSLGGIIGKLQQTKFATPQMVAYVMSANFFGLFAGVLVAGFLADRFGRKTLYTYNLIIFAIFTVLSGFAPNINSLIALIALTAFGSGGEVAVGFSLIIEYFPPAKRGKLGVMIMAFSNIMAPVAYFMGMFVLPLGDQSWRYIFILAGFPALYVWYLRRGMPESPRWLESVERFEEAEKIISKIEAEVAKSTGKELPPVKEAIVYKKEKFPPFSELFKLKNIRITLLCMFLYCSIYMMSYSLISWLPTYFMSKGINVRSSMLFSTLMVFGMPIGVFTSAFVVDFGRKRAIVIAAIIGSIVAYFYSQATSLNVIIPLGFLTLVCIYVIAGTVQGVYAPELFPTLLRGRGVSVTESIGRLGTVASPLLVVWISQKWGFSTVIFCVCMLMFLVALFTGLFGTETGKRSLEDINEKQQGMLG